MANPDPSTPTPNGPSSRDPLARLEALLRQAREIVRGGRWEKWAPWGRMWEREWSRLSPLDVSSPDVRSRASQMAADLRALSHQVLECIETAGRERRRRRNVRRAAEVYQTRGDPLRP